MEILAAFGGYGMAGTASRDWIVALAYAAVAMQALLAARVSPDDRDRNCWFAISSILLLLGAAKQLQLQGIVTDWIRTLARSYHLYDYRMVPQILLILAVLGVSFAAWRYFDGLFHSRPPPVVGGVTAMTGLAAFILIRAASLHPLDPLTETEVAGLRLGWWIELGVLFAIAVAAGAFFFSRTPLRRTRRDRF